MGLRDFAISQVMGADSSCPAVTECFQHRHYYRSQHESLPRVMKLGEKGTRHPAAVPIVGETGTGEEMIARLITIIPCALSGDGGKKHGQRLAAYSARPKVIQVSLILCSLYDNFGRERHLEASSLSFHHETKSRRTAFALRV
ncbi:MAG TPA: hypothetical protein VKB88_40310 [Bryobacteraceae bacterium]|nr:hypothetical protein [Bryobacteraceae bacterium]